MRFLDDILAFGVATVVMLVMIALLPESPIRVVLGLAFVLFFPGYTLVAALYPRKDDLDGIERLALSLGLSLAVVPLIGLALNYLPWGIKLTPLIVSLTVFTAVCSILAVRNRARLASPERFPADIRPVIQGVRDLPWRVLLLSGVAITLMLLLGFRYGFLGHSRVGEPFTEFYVLGPAGKAEGYPQDLLPSEQATIVLGVINHEGHDQTYTIEARAQGTTVKRVGPIRLANDQKWESKTSFILPRPGDRIKVEFLLYTPESRSPYRTLHLWLRVRTLP